MTTQRIHPPHKGLSWLTHILSCLSSKPGFWRLSPSYLKYSNTLLESSAVERLRLDCTVAHFVRVVEYIEYLIFHLCVEMGFQHWNNDQTSQDAQAQGDANVLFPDGIYPKPDEAAVGKLPDEDSQGNRSPKSGSEHMTRSSCVQVENELPPLTEAPILFLLGRSVWISCFFKDGVRYIALCGMVGKVFATLLD